MPILPKLTFFIAKSCFIGYVLNKIMTIIANKIKF